MCRRYAGLSCDSAQRGEAVVETRIARSSFTVGPGGPFATVFEYQGSGSDNKAFQRPLRQALSLRIRGSTSTRPMTSRHKWQASGVWHE